MGGWVGFHGYPLVPASSDCRASMPSDLTSLTSLTGLTGLTGLTNLTFVRLQAQYAIRELPAEFARLEALATEEDAGRDDGSLADGGRDCVCAAHLTRDARLVVRTGCVVAAWWLCGGWIVAGCWW